MKRSCAGRHRYRACPWTICASCEARTAVGPGSRDLRWLAESVERVQDSRPLLRVGAFPGRCLSWCSCPCDGAGRSICPGSGGCRLARKLHGLEIDPRCVELAAFALAFAAWRYPVGRLPATARAEFGLLGSLHKRKERRVV